MKGVLLVNLGSPASTSTKDIRKYLDQFLMDERVIDIPYWKRYLLIKGIILNTRPKKSAKAYKKYNILDNVKKMELLLAKGLSNLDQIQNVRHCGLLFGFEHPA